MNLEELKKVVEKNLVPHDPIKHGYAGERGAEFRQVFNPSLVSKLLMVVEAASGISEGSDWNNGPYANKHRKELLAALRDLEQS